MEIRETLATRENKSVSVIAEHRTPSYELLTRKQSRIYIRKLNIHVAETDWEQEQQSHACLQT
jgi:hypothetical protein